MALWIKRGDAAARDMSMKFDGWEREDIGLAPYGIRSNTIAPTSIETPMTAPSFADAAFRRSSSARSRI